MSRSQKAHKAGMLLGVFVLVGLFFVTTHVYGQSADPQTTPEKKDSKASHHTKEIEDLKAKLAKDPKNIDLLMELGKYCGWDEDLKGAVDAYEKVLAVDPNHLGAKKKLGDFYSWVDEPAKSAQAIEDVLKVEPGDMELMTKLGERYTRLGKYTEAKTLYQDVLKKDPQNVKAKQGLEEVTGYLEPAKASPAKKDTTHKQRIEELKAQLAKDPKNIDLLMELGKYCGWDEDLKGAVDAYEKVLAVDPNNLAAKKKLADFYSWVDQPAKSAQAIEDVLKVEPNNLELMAKLGDRYTRLKKYKEAEAVYRRILEKDPENLGAQRGLANLSSATSKYTQAVKDYLGILPRATTQKEKVDIYRRVADTYYYSRDYVKAKEYAQEALKLNPDDEDARRRLKTIEEYYRPRIFTDNRFQSFKGDSDRAIYDIGFEQPTEYGFTVMGIYRHYRWTSADEDRYSYDSGLLELSRYMGDGLTVAVGGEAKFYSTDAATGDYYLRANKEFQPDLQGVFMYQKMREDDEPQKLYQHVDRHAISGTMYHDFNNWFSLNTNLEGRYYTQGDCYSDNFRLSGYISPVFHIIASKPTFDISYTYYRIGTVKKDRNPDETFEYYAPKRVDSHSVNFYFAHDFTPKLTIIAADTLGWINDVDNEWYLQHQFLTEIIFKITENQRLAGSFSHSRQVYNASSTTYKDEEWRIRYSYKF